MPKLNSLNVDYRKVLKGVNNHMLVGQVKKVNKATSERTVACVKLSLDPKLLKYFNARMMFRTIDDTNESKFGDIVLIKCLERPRGHLVNHRIEEVIYGDGAIVDPFSGKQCQGTDYEEEAHNPNFERYMAEKKKRQSLPDSEV